MFHIDKGYEWLAFDISKKNFYLYILRVYALHSISTPRAMIEIKLQQQVAKIHRLNIYFILPDRALKSYGDDIKRLNNYCSVTLGLFEFRCLRRSGSNFSKLPQPFADALAKHNMVAALYDCDKQSGSYAFCNVDLAGDGDRVIDTIQTFVHDVCRRNIELIDAYVEQLKAASKERYNKRIEIYQYIQQRFRYAMKVVYMQKPQWRATDNTDIETLCSKIREVDAAIGAHKSDLYAQINADLTKYLTRANNSNKAVLAICKMEEYYGHITKSISDANLQALLVGTEMEIPTISAELVPTTLYGKSKKRYGIVISTDSVNTSVIFTVTNTAMLYFTALLRYKAGRPLYLKELFRPMRGGLSLKDKQLNKMLRTIYKTIIINEDTNAAEWIKKVGCKESKGHPLYQAKTNATVVINKAVDPAIANYCRLVSKSDERGESYYTFECPPENIRVDERLQKILDHLV